MNFHRLGLAGLVEITPQVHADARGSFAETFRQDRFDAAIAPLGFVQENQSLSRAAGTIRGIHFQTPPKAQGKLVRCIAGAVFDVAVDLRHGSPQFGQWEAIELSAENGRQLWIPAGFGHGFCTLAANTVLSYKVTEYYSPQHDHGVIWDDPDIAIDWPALADPATLSAKDRAMPAFCDLSPQFIMGDTDR